MVSLKMKVEVIRVGDRVTTASPLIQQFKFGNRSAETALNMRDGETIVSEGASGRRSRTRVTMPWIDLLIGKLLSSFKTDRIFDHHSSHCATTLTPGSAIKPTVVPIQLATSPVFPSTSRRYRLRYGVITDRLPLAAVLWQRTGQLNAVRSLVQLATPGRYWW